MNLLDLPVLTSLQAGSFKVHWIPAGIGEAGLPAPERLQQAETYAWTPAKKVLAEEQLRTLRDTGRIRVAEAENMAQAEKAVDETVENIRDEREKRNARRTCE